MATSSPLRQRYFSNRFVDLVRMELRVDESEWGNLKECLSDLAAEWHGIAEVDKDIVQDLFVLPAIVRGVADRLEEKEPGRAKDLEERATELDALVLAALA